MKQQGMRYHPDYCYECQMEDPALADGLTRSSWKFATAKCVARCGNKVCETRHPLYRRGFAVKPGEPGKCGECDYQDYLNSPGGM